MSEHLSTSKDLGDAAIREDAEDRGATPPATGATGLRTSPANARAEPHEHRWLIDISGFDPVGWAKGVTLTCLVPNCGKVSVLPQELPE